MIFDSSYKILIDSKPLHIKSDKMDGFIRIYDGTRYLTLFASEKYDAIYSRIRSLTSLISGIIYIFLKLIPMFVWLKKKYCVLILVKSVLKKDKNHYYYKIFSEKCSYQLAEK